jgi:multidrug transporter EmrE-like cation transporter
MTRRQFRNMYKEWGILFMYSFAFVSILYALDIISLSVLYAIDIVLVGIHTYIAHLDTTWNHNFLSRKKL